MSTSFSQRVLGVRHSFEIQSNHLVILQKHWLAGSKEQHIHLGHINLRPERRQVIYAGRAGLLTWLIVLPVFMLILNGINPFTSIAGILFWGLLFMLVANGLARLLREEYLIFSIPNDRFFLYRNRRNQERVDEFVVALQTAVEHFFLDTYGQVREDLPRDVQLQNFYWLHINDFIDTTTYTSLKARLNQIVPPKNMGEEE